MRHNCHSEKNFGLLLAVMMRSGVPQKFEELLAEGKKPGGRKRALSVAILLTAMLASYLKNKSLLFVDIYYFMKTEMTFSAQVHYGIRTNTKVLLITQKMVYRLWEDICKHLQWTGLRIELDEHDVIARQKQFQQFCDWLCEAVLPNQMPFGGAYAIDATGIDSFANGSSPYANKQFRGDPDGAWGYRTKTRLHPISRVGGYHAVPVLRVPSKAEEVPMLIERFLFLPANVDEVPIIVGVFGEMLDTGKVITEIMADRAYSHAIAEHFARPLRQMGINQVIDLRQDQRGVIKYKGALWIDGWLYCPQMPKRLWHITRPNNFTHKEIRARYSAKHKAAIMRHNKQIDDFIKLDKERELYAYELKQETKTGQQFKSPARAGKVQCTGCPMTMSGKSDVPVLSKPPAKMGLACSQDTILVPWEWDEKIRQHYRWGSPKWRNAYFRRNRIEGQFGIWQGIGSGTVNRGWTAVMGLVKTGLMLAIVIMATNLEAIWRYQKKHPEQIIDDLIVQFDDDFLVDEIPIDDDAEENAPPEIR